MTITREELFARYKELDTLAVDYDTAMSEPLYSLRTQAFCDYLRSDPNTDWGPYILFQFGARFARLPLLPETCPTPKETKRVSGIIGYVSRDYGYISVKGEDDVRFLTRHVLGHVPMKGDRVTFTRGEAGNALDVVLEDAATSREAYSAKQQQRPATAPVRRGRANFGEGFKPTENAEELAKAREIVQKLRGE